MVKKKTKLGPNEPIEIPMDNLDLFVVQVIEALKDTKDPYAVAFTKNTVVNSAMQELFLFVGITVKQAESSALFAWTDAVKSSKVSWPNETETK